ncbi:MAG TPA: hypothetical protein VGF82_02700 [Terracidiphilus sp.]|jgi:ElaB/YqjD/DUF883 family membrane-anchored ribosome-binding protein
MPADLLNNTSVEDVIREVSRLKDVVTEAVQDGVETAVKTIKQGREVAEDAIDDARRRVKQRPFESVGVVFAAGILTGAFLTWISSRRG